MRRLAFLAAHTSKIDFGLLVTGVTYRHPGLLAKIVTTFDVLSGGRAVLGAAWFEREHRALGNLYATSPADVEHKLDVLRRHCDDLGRDFGTIRVTVAAMKPRPEPGTRDQFVRQMAAYARIGVHTAIITRSSAPRPPGSTAWPRSSRSWPNSAELLFAAGSGKKATAGTLSVHIGQCPAGYRRWRLSGAARTGDRGTGWRWGHCGPGHVVAPFCRW
ncbi:LLM class flavin-dependent oxidoreductase [Amycolatopsis sp. NBC_00345]|uniref:LLM class flavin-dependent oxidoreductase n=1 Tax=Amycolatopsis sp. NBC_00345 TaxID=2975955 RepID=UPI00324CA3F9